MDIEPIEDKDNMIYYQLFNTHIDEEDNNNFDEEINPEELEMR